MAYASIVFENPHTGVVKEAPVGFSWTSFFFGFFPALFRGDFKWAFIMFLIACMTFGLSSLVFMFIYNKIYIKELISSGFKAKSFSNADEEILSYKLGIRIPLASV